MWFNGQVSVKSAKALRVNIEAVRGKDATSDIAIDDLDFIPRACVISPESAVPSNQVTIPIITTTRSLRPVSTYDCNFETGFGMWKPTSESTFNWTRAQGKDSPTNAGPLSADHTLGTSSGWYIFANLLNRQITDIARLESGILSGPRCMEFYYYFYSNAKYKFNIYMKKNNLLGLPIWSRENSNANYWRLGRLTLPSGTGTFSLVLSLNGQFGSATISDRIALDDIFFTVGSCPESTAVNKVCSFSDDTLCGLQKTSENNFDWQLYLPPQSLYTQEEIARADTGPLPIYDHTTEGVGSGYVYVKSSGIQVGSTATLQTQTYIPFSTNVNDTGRCLEFYFFIQDTDSVILNVKGKTLINNQVKYLLWSREVDHSQFWWKGEVNVNFYTNYTLIYEAVVGNNSANGVAAMDDISLRNGACSR
jgi:hypothetical protein